MRSKIIAGILISVCTFLVLSLSSCYFKPPHHMDDDRGYYRDKDHNEHHYKTRPRRKDR